MVIKLVDHIALYVYPQLKQGVVMSNELINQDSTIKQANKLIESVYRMEANEQKIILLAIKQVYEKEKRKEPFTERTEIIITGSEYAREYGISRQTAFEVIRDAKNTLYERSFEYDYLSPETGELKPMSSRWIHAKGETKVKSEISIFFAPAVIPFVYLVQKEFTLLDIREVGRLKSKYAIRLYQLLMKWRNAEFQPKFDYQDLRDKLGLEDADYPVMADFKKRVVDVAVSQINKGTGFVKLKYTTIKKGVKITHFMFTYDKYDNETLNVTPIKPESRTAKEKPKMIDVTPKKKKEANTAKQSDSSDSFELTHSDPIPKKPLKRHYDFAMTESQSYLFAHKMIKKIKDKDARFMHLSDLAYEGETEESFLKRIVDDLQVGSFKQYAEALKILGYKHHNDSADSQLRVGE